MIAGAYIISRAKHTHQSTISHQEDQYHINSNCNHDILIGMCHGPVYNSPGNLGVQYFISCHR